MLFFSFEQFVLQPILPPLRLGAAIDLSPPSPIKVTPRNDGSELCYGAFYPQIQLPAAISLYAVGRQLHRYIHIVTKTAEEYFQSKCQHAVQGIIRRNFSSRNCSSNWPALHFHDQLLARDGSFSSSLYNPWSSMRMFVVYARFQVIAVVSPTIQIS